MTTSSTPRRAVPSRSRRVFSVLGLAVLLAAGVWMIVAGLTPGAPEDAPLPDSFTATLDPDPVESPEPAVLKQLSNANRLVVPSIDVDAPLVKGGIYATSDGHRLDIPSDPAKLTISSTGAKACATEGTTLVAGHVSSYGVHGALWTLSKISANDVAYLTCANGKVTTWRAVSVDVQQKADLDQSIFDADGVRRLVVVTCGGPVMADGHYRDNVVVTFLPAETSQ